MMMNVGDSDNCELESFTTIIGLLFLVSYIIELLFIFILQTIPNNL